jgi:glycosyltransferase involved in cell wall biosynthesis
MNKLNEKLLISIIMPAYNVEKYIAQSIKSVIAQTYNNWELIIIDDGSTDQTATIVKQFVSENNKIKYLLQANAKQAVARNNGIAIAKGTILAFLDSDDLWLPNKLEQTLAVFDLDKFDLVFTNSYISNAEDLNINCTNFKDLHVKSHSYFGKDALKLFITGNRIPILTVLVKKSAVQDVGLFDKECVPAEDYDLWVRLLKKGYRFFSIKENTAIYRIHQNSSTAIDRLAASAVVKSITNNFTPTELKDLKVQLSLKNWIIN